MDEKEGDSVLSLGRFMDEMNIQPFNNGGVVVESVERLVLDKTPCAENIQTYLFKSSCSRFQSKLVSHSVRNLSKRLKLIPAEVPVLMYTLCAGSIVPLIWSSIRGTLDDRSMWNGCS